MSVVASKKLLACALALGVMLATGYRPVLAVERAPAEAFASLPRLASSRLSPDGQYLAYLLPVEGRQHLAVVDLSGATKPVLVPPVEDLDFRWLRWANQDRIVFSMSFFAKVYSFVETTQTRLLSIRRDGAGLTSLVQPATRTKVGTRVPVDIPSAQIQDNVIDWLPGDPGHILVALDADLDGRLEVRRIDVENGDYEIVTDGRPYIETWITDGAGQLRFGHGLRGTTRVFTLRTADGNWSADQLEQWPWGSFLPVAFTDEPSVAYVQGRGKSGRSVIRKLDLVKGEFTATVFEHDAVDAGGIVFDPVTGRPAGVAYVEHDRRVAYFDETMQGLQRSMDKALPDTANRIVNMSDDRSRVLVLASSDIVPGIYYLWDRNRKSLDIVGEVQPGLTAQVLAPVEPVKYQARDGTIIPAYLTVPRAAGRENLPAVILPHGGPSARVAKSFDYLAQFLASRGYAVLQPNFRGSTGYGEAFANAGVKQWGGLMQDDITDGARWLVAGRIADPARLCIVGWSYGGYAAAMGAIKTPELYRCAVSVNGILDLVSYVNHMENFVGGSYASQHVGLAGQDIKTVSPFHEAERIDIPMLIVQAEDDPVVPSDQGKRMTRRLKRFDKPVELLTVKFGGHEMTNEQARLTVLQSLEAFLDRHIGRNN